MSIKIFPLRKGLFLLIQAARNITVNIYNIFGLPTDFHDKNYKLHYSPRLKETAR